MLTNISKEKKQNIVLPSGTDPSQKLKRKKKKKKKKHTNKTKTKQNKTKQNKTKQNKAHTFCTFGYIWNKCNDWPTQLLRNSTNPKYRWIKMGKKIYHNTIAYDPTETRD